MGYIDQGRKEGRSTAHSTPSPALIPALDGAGRRDASRMALSSPIPGLHLLTPLAQYRQRRTVPTCERVLLTMPATALSQRTASRGGVPSGLLIGVSGRPWRAVLSGFVWPVLGAPLRPAIRFISGDTWIAPGNLCEKNNFASLYLVVLKVV